MSDGGVVALTGFLYQLVATSATILRSPELNSVLALEKYEEDAALMFELPVLANMGKINFNPTTQSFNASNPLLGQNNKKSLASKLLPPLLKSK